MRDYPLLLFFRGSYLSMSLNRRVGDIFLATVKCAPPIKLTITLLSITSVVSATRRFVNGLDRKGKTSNGQQRTYEYAPQQHFRIFRFSTAKPISAIAHQTNNGEHNKQHKRSTSTQKGNRIMNVEKRKKLRCQRKRKRKTIR